MEGLMQSDEELCAQLVLQLYSNGVPIRQILDEVVSAAFHKIGDQWECRKVEVYQERRACEICASILKELKRVIQTPSESAPLAIGASVSGDPFTLPSMMVEIVLREMGFRATSLGSGIPFSSLMMAATELRPRLFWISSSAIGEVDSFVTEFNRLADSIRNSTALVLGGRAVTPEIRSKIQFTSCCNSLQQLESVARTLLANSYDQ